MSAPYAGAPVPYGPPGGVLPYGPPGRQRSTGLGMVLFVVTFGIYGLVWAYSVHRR